MQFATLGKSVVFCMKQEFETTSFYLACFLATRGMKLMRVDRSPHQRRASFVFQDSKDRTDLVDAFSLGGDAMVDAGEFAYQIRRMKGALYDGMN